MSWREQVFIYCERGGDPAFWAEPANALSNAAFLLAAGLALRQWSRLQPGRGRAEPLVLIVLVATIGVGSFLFHSFAERWSALADVIPIGVFMLLYLAVALRRLVGLGNAAMIALSLVFALACFGATSVRCSSGPCLGGSIAYVPAVAALSGVAVTLWVMGHPAWRLLGLAAIVFPVSLTARTLDLPLCAGLALAGGPLGTHFLWHLMNAVTLYLLLAARLRHGPSAPGQ